MESQRKGLILITIHNPNILDSTMTTTSSINGNNGSLQQEQEQQQQLHLQQLQQQQRNQKQNEIKTEVTGIPSMKFAKMYMKYRNAAPLRLCAYHLCTPDTPFYKMVVAFNTMILASDQRCRIKVHVGTYCAHLQYY